MTSQTSNCIVTGGAGGIGEQVVRFLRMKGWRVAVIDTVQPREADLYVDCDLTVASTADAAFARCFAAFGGIDAAVNAAGVFGPMTPVESIGNDQLDTVTFGNIRMCINSMKNELTHMKHRKRGRIVNVASVAGTSGVVLKGDYVAAKHAIIGLTKTAALENVRDGIAVNSVSPGFVDTPMTTSAIASNPLLEKFIGTQTPLGRSISPSAVADLICWLVSAAPIEITGGDYVIDGCYSAR